VTCYVVSYRMTACRAFTTSAAADAFIAAEVERVMREQDVPDEERDDVALDFEVDAVDLETGGQHGEAMGDGE